LEQGLLNFKDKTMYLETLKTKEMHKFFENPRGGLTDARILYTKANNKYCSYFNPNEPSTYIFDIDATNLYGHLMIQELPCNDFKFETIKKEYDEYVKKLKSINEQNVTEFKEIINYKLQLNNYNSKSLKQKGFDLGKFYKEEIDERTGKINKVFDEDKVKKSIKSDEFKKDIDVYISNLEYFDENMSYK
jgi:hypothetical protein